MGVGTSIVVFAIGAILKFATTVHSSSFNIQTIGVILMIVGAVGFVLSLFFWSSWGGFGGGGYRRRTVRSGYVDDPRVAHPVDPRYRGPVGPGAHTVIEEEQRGGY